MHRPLLLLTATALTTSAQAQPAPAAAEAAVLSFPAAFFAEAQPASAYDMVVRVPGFAFDAGDADVRGFAGSAGNVLVDGRRPASKQDTLTDLLKRIPASAVLRIDLIRGGTGGIDMQGQPVVANIIRRSEAATRGRIEASFGRYGDGRVTPAGRADVSHKSGAVLTEASLALERTVDDEKGRGPRTRTNPDGSRREALIYDEHDGFRNANASIGHERPLLGGKLRANLSLKRVQERAATSLDTSFPSLGKELVLELERQEEGEIGATWDRPLSSVLALELTALDRENSDKATEHSNDGTEINDVGSRSRGAERIGRALLRWQAASGLSVEGGGEGAFNYLDSHASYAVNGVPVLLPAANVRVAEHRAEGFATATWQVVSPLSVEAGLRVETSTLVQSGDSNLTKSFVFAKPHVFVTWAAEPRTQFRARVERLVGQLDFGDFVSSTSLTSSTITAGNRDLEPDRRWVSSLAWERRFWGEGALVLTARHDQITATVDRIGVIGPGYAFDAPGNIGSGNKTRLSASVSLPLDRLHVPGGLLKFDGGYRWTSVIDPTTGVRRAISGETPIDGEIHFTQDRPQIGFRWGIDAILGTHKQEFRFNEIRTSSLGTRVSLFAEYRPAAGWTLRAFADNLTGRRVQRERAIYANGRNIAPLRYVERRDLETRTLIGILARRSFGS